MRNGYAECSQWEYLYARLDNGVRLNLPLRQLYLNLDEGVRARFGNPFETGREDSFLEWATRPRPDGLSRFLESLYRVRRDVARAFPDVNGRDRIPRAQPDKFHDWDWNYKQLLILPTPAPQSRRFAVVAGRPRPCD